MKIGDRVEFNGRTGKVVGFMPQGMVDVQFTDVGHVERRSAASLTVQGARTARTNPGRSGRKERRARQTRRNPVDQINIKGVYYSLAAEEETLDRLTDQILSLIEARKETTEPTELAETEAALNKLQSRKERQEELVQLIQTENDRIQRAKRRFPEPTKEQKPAYKPKEQVGREPRSAMDVLIRESKAAFFTRHDPLRLAPDFSFCGNPIDGTAYYLVVSSDPRKYSRYLTWNTITKTRVVQGTDGEEREQSLTYVGVIDPNTNMLRGTEVPVRMQVLEEEFDSIDSMTRTDLMDLAAELGIAVPARIGYDQLKMLVKTGWARDRWPTEVYRLQSYVDVFQGSERELLEQLLVMGLTFKEIAAQLGITEETLRLALPRREETDIASAFAAQGLTEASAELSLSFLARAKLQQLYATQVRASLNDARLEALQTDLLQLYKLKEASQSLLNDERLWSDEEENVSVERTFARLKSFGLRPAELDQIKAFYAKARDVDAFIQTVSRDGTWMQSRREEIAAALRELYLLTAQAVAVVDYLAPTDVTRLTSIFAPVRRSISTVQRLGLLRSPPDQFEEQALRSAQRRSERTTRVIPYLPDGISQEDLNKVLENSISYYGERKAYPVTQVLPQFDPRGKGIAADADPARDFYVIQEGKYVFFRAEEVINPAFEFVNALNPYSFRMFMSQFDGTILDNLIAAAARRDISMSRDVAIELILSGCVFVREFDPTTSKARPSKPVLNPDELIGTGADIQVVQRFKAFNPMFAWQVVKGPEANIDAAEPLDEIQVPCVGEATQSMLRDLQALRTIFYDLRSIFKIIHTVVNNAASSEGGKTTGSLIQFEDTIRKLLTTLQYLQSLRDRFEQEKDESGLGGAIAKQLTATIDNLVETYSLTELMKLAQEAQKLGSVLDPSQERKVRSDRVQGYIRTRKRKERAADVAGPTRKLFAAQVLFGKNVAGIEGVQSKSGVLATTPKELQWKLQNKRVPTPTLATSALQFFAALVGDPVQTFGIEVSPENAPNPMLGMLPFISTSFDATKLSAVEDARLVPAHEYLFLWYMSLLRNPTVTRQLLKGKPHEGGLLNDKVKQEQTTYLLGRAAIDFFGTVGSDLQGAYARVPDRSSKLFAVDSPTSLLSKLEKGIAPTPQGKHPSVSRAGSITFKFIPPKKWFRPSRKTVTEGKEQFEEVRNAAVREQLDENQTLYKLIDAGLNEYYSVTPEPGISYEEARKEVALKWFRIILMAETYYHLNGFELFGPLIRQVSTTIETGEGQAYQLRKRQAQLEAKNAFQNILSDIEEKIETAYLGGPKNYQVKELNRLRTAALKRRQEMGRKTDLGKAVTLDEMVETAQEQDIKTFRPGFDEPVPVTREVIEDLMNVRRQAFRSGLRKTGKVMVFKTYNPALFKLTQLLYPNILAGNQPIFQSNLAMHSLDVAGRYGCMLKLAMQASVASPRLGITPEWFAFSKIYLDTDTPIIRSIDGRMIDNYPDQNTIRYIMRGLKIEGPQHRGFVSPAPFGAYQNFGELWPLGMTLPTLNNYYINIGTSPTEGQPVGLFNELTDLRAQFENAITKLSRVGSEVETENGIIPLEILETERLSRVKGLRDYAEALEKKIIDPVSAADTTPDLDSDQYRALLFKALTETYPSIPAVLLTGSIEEQQRRWSLEKRALMFLNMNEEEKSYYQQTGIAPPDAEAYTLHVVKDILIPQQYKLMRTRPGTVLPPFYGKPEDQQKQIYRKSIWRQYDEQLGQENEEYELLSQVLGALKTESKRRAGKIKVRKAELTSDQLSEMARNQAALFELRKSATPEDEGNLREEDALTNPRPRASERNPFRKLEYR